MTLIKPLKWTQATEEQITAGLCFGREEEVALLGKWDLYRIYPVSEGRWRWVRQFRATIISGSQAEDDEITSATAAKKGAWADWSAYISDFVDTDLMDQATRFSLADRVSVEYRGEGRWAISNGSAVYNTYGEWEFEPMPSARDKVFLDRVRYTRDDAILIARELIEGSAIR